jgi:hypothetical protein
MGFPVQDPGDAGGRALICRIQNDLSCIGTGGQGSTQKTQISGTIESL